MNDQNKDTLLEFPCDFPIKVMGKNHTEFELEVLSIVNRHVETLKEGAVKTRPSKNGNYISITVTIEAHSKDQLDNIYQELTAHEMVMMAL